jgi:1-acyl-sn-glycerol-3-phosphate acyltransferase
MTLPRPSPLLIRLFKVYLRAWYLPRNFHAVRLSRAGGLPPIPDGPLIIVSNHPSWWDPCILSLLTDQLPNRRHFAPIDAAALAQYRFFRRLGMFGIEPGTAAGARKFLRTAQQLLETSDAALWVTAQGRFADVRERPVRLQGGVGHLAARLGRGTILPLALEYAFWQERFPEALARFGKPIRIHEGVSAGQWTRLIERGLESTQDDLAAEAIQQNAELFDSLLTGQAGIGGVYDLWRRCRARWRGEIFTPEHGSLTRRSAP